MSLKTKRKKESGRLTFSFLCNGDDSQSLYNGSKNKPEPDEENPAVYIFSCLLIFWRGNPEFLQKGQKYERNLCMHLYAYEVYKLGIMNFSVFGA